MSDVFIVDLFYFQINKNITIICCIESTFLQVCQNISNTWYWILCKYFTYKTKIIYTTLVYFTIYPYFSFLSLCVSKCVAWKIFHIYFQVCMKIFCSEDIFWFQSYWSKDILHGNFRLHLGNSMVVIQTLFTNLTPLCHTVC